jgi:hypothetical protein
MRQIAARELKNPDRWSEIAALNPSWRPEYPLPAGTVLALPASER